MQLLRTKGWRKDPAWRVVTRPGAFGNPFQVRDYFLAGHSGDERAAAQAVVHAHRSWLTDDHLNMAAWTSRIRLPPKPDLSLLRGRVLLCWCPIHGPDGRRWPCHADTLIELANPEGDDAS